MVRKSRFEDFPDELLLMVCRYLDPIDILNGLTCLNVRFSHVINEFVEEINLNSIPLKLIDRFRDQIFTHINSNVRSLIYNDNLQRYPIDLSFFQDLQSIHFLNSFSEDFLLNVKEIQIDSIPNIKQTDLIERFFSSNEFSNLKHLSLTSFHGLTFSYINLTNFNRIEHLTVTVKNNVDLFELLHLLSSSIIHLNVHILYNGPFKSLSTSPLKLDRLHYFHLKTTFEDSIQFKQLEKLIVESFVSLQSLSIETFTRDQNYINGNQWERFLKKILSLKHFQCSIRYRFKINDDDNQQSREEKLFNSFSTDFWLNQRKWFINSYSTISIPDENSSTHYSRGHSYGKLFLHTIPYPYVMMDATIDINTAKSTINQFLKRSHFDESFRHIYSNVRQLYFDGENLPIKLINLQIFLDQFKLINELKLDRLMIEPSTSSSLQIKLPHLKKLTIYNDPNNDKYSLNITFLNLSSLYNLRYIRLPQMSLPDYSQMPERLETLVLTECRDLHFDFIHKYKTLRTFKLSFSSFDRLLENDSRLLISLIKTIYTENKTMELLQFICHGANQTKMKTFEKQFNSNRIDYLNAIYDGKCLDIQRSEDFFHTF